MHHQTERVKEEKRKEASWTQHTTKQTRNMELGFIGLSAQCARKQTETREDGKTCDGDGMGEEGYRRMDGDANDVIYNKYQTNGTRRTISITNRRRQNSTASPSPSPSSFNSSTLGISSPHFFMKAWFCTFFVPVTVSFILLPCQQLFCAHIHCHLDTSHACQNGR